MNPDLFLRLARWRTFWRLRAFVDLLRFKVLRRLFMMGAFVREERENFSPMLEIAKGTVQQFFFAFIFALALQLGDQFLARKRVLLEWVTPNASDYFGFLGTVAQIGGVFLGLYYAGLTTAAAAIYSSVPNNIRDLLVREKVGNVYVRFLTFVTFLPLCLMALSQVGLGVSRTSVAAVLIAAGIGIIAFVNLGRRAFYLFDPTRLSYSIFDDLGTWVKQVTAGGFRWLDRSFQNHAHRMASSTVDVLKTLADISAAQRNLSGAPFVQVCGFISGFLSAYQKRKKLIPIESLWYEQKRRHPDWYLTADSTVQVAYATGTTLQPDSVANFDWLEQRLHPIVLKCWEINLEPDRFDLTHTLAQAAQNYVSTLAEDGAVQGALTFADRVQNVVRTRLIPVDANEKSPTETLDHVGMADWVAVFPIQILVAFVKALPDWNPEKMRQRLRHIDWRRTDSPYRQGFPLHVLGRLAWLQPRLEFERLVEGRGVTPLWYQEAFLNVAVAERFVENVKALLRANEEFYEKFAELFVSLKRPLFAATISSRQLEYVSKLERHLNSLENTWREIEKVGTIKGLPWPQIDTKEWFSGLKDHRKKLVHRIAVQSIVLLSKKRPDGFPDLRGQFVHAIGETLFDALESGDNSMVRTLMGPYMIGCLGMWDELRPTVVSDELKTTQQLPIAAAPILDLLALSGYCYFFGEYHGKPDLWEEVKKVWDTYLAEKPETIKFLSAVVQLGDAGLNIPPRALLRTNWSMRVASALRNLPNTDPRAAQRVILTGSVIHSSPLVRYYAHDVFRKGFDLFVTVYLANRPEAKDVKWGSALDVDLLRAMSKEDTERESENEETGLESGA